jgi:ABC-type nickel/cobalt efflux system permease component RcnA
MDGSLLQFVLAVFTAMLLQTWYLHREIRRSHAESIRHTNRSHDQLRADFADYKTHTTDSFGQLRESHSVLRTDFQRSHDQLRADFNEHKHITERNHRETHRQLSKLADGLGDARERLSRIEGYLRIGLPEPPEAAAGG